MWWKNVKNENISEVIRPQIFTLTLTTKQDTHKITPNQKRRKNKVCQARKIHKKQHFLNATPTNFRVT